MIMARVLLPGTTPCAGDLVIHRGTRIVGDVTRIIEVSDQVRISLKVTDALGKSRTSKTARAWRGAWVTCTPDAVALQN